MSISLIAFLLIVSLLGYFALPIIVWFGSLAFYFYVFTDVSIFFWILYILVFAPFLVKNVRKKFITTRLVSLIKKLKLLPTISETEKIALRSGSVWIDAELFSGKPDFKKIFSYDYPELSQEERDFMNNQVEKLCNMIKEVEVFEQRDLPEEVWEYLKKEKFFGMIIPKEYGGLGFSALANSSVVGKIASRSQVVAITTMVPNSLGPAELLVHYGTKEQKDYYLPRLAIGEDIPCFGLTEPTAGSDATSIKAEGVLFKDNAGEIKVKLNFNKRYITLGAKATVIGLAFNLKDPENLLKKDKIDLGITCALIKSDTAGVKADRRHDPMGVPFINSPVQGKDVVISISDIIGAEKGIGEGWKMLMECLAAGRGISLPATGSGGTKYVARVSGAYSRVRKQFGLPIGKFEGVEEVLARMAGYSYMLEAARKFIAGEIDNGGKPAVINAIAKYHFTEKFRETINDGMDILGGSAICMGPKNMLAYAYMSTPIAITVEGANIMTRSLIHFGQGAIRCHPYSYTEMVALMENDLDKFDMSFWAHVRHLVSNIIRAKLFYISRGRLFFVDKKENYHYVTKRYIKKIAWASSVFAVMADLALARHGGNLKRKEKLNGRFGDALSYMFFATAILRRFEAEGQKSEDIALVKWSLNYCFYKVQQSFEGIYDNFSEDAPFRIIMKIVKIFSKLNSFASYPRDVEGAKIAKILMTPSFLRDRLTADIFVPSLLDEKSTDQYSLLERAITLADRADEIEKRIRKELIQANITENKKLSFNALVEKALNEGVIDEEEKQVFLTLEELRNQIIQVDSYSMDDYNKFLFSKGTVA